MNITIADLKKGEQGIITDSSSKDIPLKLLEMGCLPGNKVKLFSWRHFQILCTSISMTAIWPFVKKLQH